MEAACKDMVDKATWSLYQSGVAAFISCHHPAPAFIACHRPWSLCQSGAAAFIACHRPGPTTEAILSKVSLPWMTIDDGVARNIRQYLGRDSQYPSSHEDGFVSDA